MDLIRRRGASILAFAMLWMVVPGLPAQAVNFPQTLVVTDDPANFTPNVLDGTVMAIAQVGNTIVLGGQFSQVRASGSTQTLTRINLLAFNATTGAISTTFVPSVNGIVKTLAAGLDGSVFIGGTFTTVNGVTLRRLAKLNPTTGQVITGWQANTNKAVNDMVLRSNRLFVAGEFTTIGGQARTYLAAVSPDTGVVDPNLNIPISVPFQGTSPWIRKLDVTQDSRRLVAIGNFRQAGGLDRAQVVVVDLTTSPASVANWETDRFKDLCLARFISYTKDVDFSPDGSFFVIGDTGANRATLMCDTVSRWETFATGSALQPTWINWTGGDSFVSVAVTATAIYVGGHQQMVNNPYIAPNCGFCQSYYPGPGGVWREGLAALDPVNGLPFTWDPGRARGEGVFHFLATDTGLWVGSDTDRVGRETHGRIAFFPLVGGTAIPANVPYGLPNGLFNVEPAGNMTARTFDGSTMGARHTVPGINWATTRGMFALNGSLYYGRSNGGLYARTFDGTTAGPERTVDLLGLDRTPGPDPRFVIPGTTIPIPALTDQLRNATGMFFDGGRIYYTVAGDPRLYYRYFTPQSQVIGANLFVASGNGDGRDWSNVRGMTLANGQLYFGRSDGTLNRMSFSGGVPSGTPTAIGGPAIDAYNWASQGLFVFMQGASDVTPPTKPGKPVASSSSPGSISLTWAASVDAGSSSLIYRVYRDGGSSMVGTIASPSTTTVSFTDTGLAAGSMHTYTVDAVDASGNPSPMSDPSDPVTTTSSLFRDAFDTGDLAAWDGATRVTIDATSGSAAPPSARLSVTGQSAFLWKNLATPVNTACMSTALNVTSLVGSSVTALRLRTAANGPIARLTLSSTRVVGIRSDVSGASLSSGVVLPTGWNTLVLCGTVGTAGSWNVYLNGGQIISGWVADTGTTPIGRVEIGDASAKTFTLNADDVALTQSP